MKIAFVAPFFGADAAGGAEAECRHTAWHLADAGLDVEILTTCLFDLQHDWSINCRAEGVERDGALRVRRFRVEPVDLEPFGFLNDRLIAGEVLTLEEERRLMAMHVNSFDLYRYLSAHTADYDWFCFIPYLFGTTWYGSMFTKGKTALIPCLHDEGYARTRLSKELFMRADRIVYHTRAEKRLAETLYGSLPGKQILLGEGVDTEFPADADRFRTKYGITKPFLLYAGRKDSAKNVDMLVEYFSAFKKRNGGDIQLVVIGPGRLSIIPEMEAHILDLGFVSVQDKRDAFAAADYVCQPSLFESFSLIIMEAWSRGTPCLVHGDCAVTREHVVEAGGGLYFRGFSEFEGALRYLVGNTEMARRMGEAGREYVRTHFGWDQIVKRYIGEVFV